MRGWKCFWKTNSKKVTSANNIKVLISLAGEGATVAIIEGKVSNHTSTFLAILESHSIVYICRQFSPREGSTAFPYISVIVDIVDSVFHNNLLHLLYLNTTQTDLRISNCSFLMNKYRTLVGYVGNSTLEIVFSAWHLNGG